MSWIEQLQNVEVELVLGDGERFKPLWKEAKRTKKYNTSSYNFIDIIGTLVDRQQPEGYQYDLTLFFTGASHLDVASKFQTSADDKRFWTLIHPYWGERYVQPISIEEDKTTLNTTIFKIQVWETLSNKYPLQKQLSNDRVTELQGDVNLMASKTFEAQIPVIDASLKTTLKESVDKIDSTSSKYLTLSEDFAEFKVKVSKAKSMIDDAIQAPIDVMRSIIDVINYPVEVVQSVNDRIKIAKELLSNIEAIILRKKTKDTIIVYECQASAVVAGMANATMTPNDGDYKLRSDVVNAMDSVRSAYETYLINLDSNQAVRSDVEGGYTADTDVAQNVNALVMETLANIYDYSFGAKQERVVALEEDSNPILLAHRFYGLDKEDENIQFLIDTNNLSLDELFEIKKGRKIAYYI